jgi:ABC-type branched-subunit amino acid transport system ATPase component
VEKKIEEVFSFFPALRERGKQLAGSLSGGEKQMLVLANILALFCYGNVLGTFAKTTVLPILAHS